MKKIPYGRQSLDESDIQAVTNVLRSDWLTQGPAVPEFEEAIRAYTGAPFATAVSNASVGLHLACLVLGVKPGDPVWTSPNTFLASANGARYCGAKIDFVDIDSKTYNLSPEHLELKLKQAEKNGVLPRVVIPVHFAGQPCGMEKIYQLSQKYGFAIVEDAAHAIGAEYKGEKIGTCTYSDATVFSFHPVKVMTTAEGGLIATKRKDLDDKLKILRTHGITRETGLMNKQSEGPWYYQQIDLGYNYRMSDIHAALGTSQLKRLDQFLKRRRELATNYFHALEGLPLQLPWQHAETLSAWHLYAVCLKLPKIKKTRLEVYEELHRANVGVQIHYIPVHRQPYYSQFGFKVGDFPNAEKYYEATLSLPLFPAMTDEEQNYVIKTLKEILS